MNTETHTELPWAVDPDGRDGYEWNFHIVAANDPDRRVCFMTSDGPSEANAEMICRAVNSHDALVAALRGLVNAKALSEIRSIVAGWNGEDREDGPYTHRHSSQLGATIKTRCGAVYELDAAMQRARAALSSIGGGKT